jgi:hypothetical protein
MQWGKSSYHTCHFSLILAKNDDMKWEMNRNLIRNAEFNQKWRNPASILRERSQRVG